MDRAKGYRIASVILLVFFSFGIGVAVGNQWTFRWMMAQLGIEVQGNLTLRVEALARMRTGDLAGGIVFLEDAADRAFLTLPQGRKWSELPEGLQSTLMMAKAYRTVFPPQDPTPELLSGLSKVPLPKADYCSPAMKEVLELLPVEREGS
jgi:hypothetical protein